VRTYRDLVIGSTSVKIDQCWLFGSYAKGTPRQYSDIDVAFVVEHDYDFLDTEPLLWKLTRHVDNRIEPVLIAKDTDYEGFIDEIQRTGVQVV
jgi:predicted nucleotidyltransferase